MQLGITPVFAVSEADRDAPYTNGREVVAARPRPRRAELSRSSSASCRRPCRRAAPRCIPGWGFLSENPLLATLCEQHGVTFIGPPPQVTSLMGSKTRAKAAMRAAGLQVIPGSDGVLAGPDEAQARRRRGRVPGPVQGRERRRRARHADRALGRRGRARRTREAQAEARAAFGGDRVLPREADRGRAPRRDPGVRRSLRPRRAPRRARLHGAAQPPEADRGEPVAGARRRSARARLCEAAARAAARIGYVGAGTMEMLLDPAACCGSWR